MKRRRSQAGAALITAMLIVALAASSAAFGLWHQSLWVRQAENITARAQAENLAHATIGLAQSIVAQDPPAVDHLGEGWARPTTLPNDLGEAGLILVDQQGLINLNNVVGKDGEDTDRISELRRLLELLKVPPELANAVVDWIDENSDPTLPGGAEDLEYLGRNPGHRAGNRPLADIGELRQIQGFDEPALARIASYVTALPRRTPVNVNTAPPEVLAAIFSGMDLTQARALARQRAERPFRDKQDLRSRLPESVKTVDESAFDVKSEFFIATAAVRVGRVQVIHQALLARLTGSGPGIVWVRAVAD